MPTQRIAKRVGSRLLWILSAVLPLLIFAIAMLVLFTRQQEQAIARLVLESATNAAHAVDRAIGEQIGLLNGLAANRALDDGDFELFRRDAQRMSELRPEWRTIIVTDQHQPVFNLNIAPGAPLPPLRDPDSLNAVWNTGKPAVGDLVHGFVAIRVPVRRGNRMRYTLVAPVDPIFFRDALRAATMAGEWEFVVVGSDNGVATASQGASLPPGTPLADTFLKPRTTLLSADGWWWSTPIPVNNSGWRIMVFTPIAAVKTPFLRARWIVYLAGGLSALLTIVLMLALSAAWAARREAIRLQEEIDIRDQARKALRHSEENYRITLDSIGDAVIATDRDGRIVHMNPVAEALTGWTFPDARGKPLPMVLRIIHESTREPLEDPAAAILHTGAMATLTNHTLLVSRNGMETPIADSGAPIRNEEGGITGVVLVFRDQTRERDYHKRLMASEQRFRLLVENAPDAIFVQTDGCFAYINQAATHLFGAGHADELIGRSVLERFHPDYRDAVRQRIRQLNTDRTPVPRVIEVCLRMDATPVSVEAAAVPFEYGGKAGALVFLRDMSAILQAQSDQQALEYQLHQAQKMESIGRLAGGVAHDFNNMLNVITGYAELALDKIPLQDDLHGDLHEILVAAKRSANITGQLLAFARRQTIAPRILDLNNAVERVLKMLRRLIGENIDLVWHPKADLWPVKMDPGQIDQILANLCVNARDAIADVGTITIITDTTTIDADYCEDHVDALAGDYVRLTVSDDGCGMDNETREKIFEPFFTTKDVGQGTGLGLATIYGIVRQNSGLINVYSEPGKGTTFRIYLPRYLAQAQADAKAPGEGSPMGHGELVLVVEDESLILKLAQRMLTSLNYRVLPAKTADDALRLAVAHKDEIALVITDVVMPEMNGRDLALQLRAVAPGLRCLFMSGYTADVIAHQGILEEEVNFIQKPFSRAELAIQVKDALN